MQILPVILSGGSGTRLWPLSRERYPKQLLNLTTERTLLQETALRLDAAAADIEVAANPVVVCNEEYRFITAEQLRQVGRPPSLMLLEPVGRNTAPALALAALAGSRGGADPLLLVMPADHVVENLAAFRDAISAGARQAADGAVVTFGIVPDRAETGYGYLRTGESVAGAGPVKSLQRFVEKPDLATAESYVASGEYLWNSGIFMGKASVWLALLQRYQPAMDEACSRALAEGKSDADFFRVGRQAFESCPSDSIDYALMEPLTGEAERPVAAVVVPMSAGWSDVGAWDSLWAIANKDGDGNVTRGDVVLHDTRDSLIFAESRMVSCLGVDNVVVVETADAVMVAAKDSTQDVKKIVAKLKREQRQQADNHRKVYRPWGYYDSIDGGERFQVKRIVVNPGASLSLQMHYHRAEHWIVVRGTARVTRGSESLLLSENQSTYIPLGTTHRLENPGKVPLEMIEVQSGTYLGEDDIVRFEDHYGRG